jgi:hypothetical protein
LETLDIPEGLAGVVVVVAGIEILIPLACGSTWIGAASMHHQRGAPDTFGAKLGRIGWYAAEPA